MQQFLQTYFSVMFHKMAELVSTSFSRESRCFASPPRLLSVLFSEHANMSISVIRSHAPLWKFPLKNE